MFDGEFRLLDGQKIPKGQKIAFNTWPRSGNTLLRRCLEQVTGISTGSNMPLTMTSMQHAMGMLGEEIVDERCWIIKTHHPVPIPFSCQYFSNKIIMIVRNPIDTFPSMFNLASSASHSATMPFEYHEESPEQWDKIVKFISDFHSKYFDVTLNDTLKNEKNPIYFMRFEDLLADKQKEIEGVFKFILDLDDLEGTNAQRRIIASTQKTVDTGKVYALKKTTGVKNANVYKYTPE
jgi:hypothetical protein